MKKINSYFLILLILPLVSACSIFDKARTDHEVRRLCAIDGGMKVYETVKLPAKRFNKYGEIRIPIKRSVKTSDEYYYENSTDYLKKGNPEMWRSNYKVYRKSDEKLLGEAKVYIRRGGDIPGPWHPSSFMCPEEASLKYLQKNIFVK